MRGPGHVQLGLQRGKRGAQFVARLLQEILIVAGRCLQPVEHLVQRDREAAQLVLRVRQIEAVIQPGGSDRCRLPAQPLDRPDSETGNEPATSEVANTPTGPATAKTAAR